MIGRKGSLDDQIYAEHLQKMMQTMLTVYLINLKSRSFYEIGSNEVTCGGDINSDIQGYLQTAFYQAARLRGDYTLKAQLLSSCTTIM